MDRSFSDERKGGTDKHTPQTKRCGVVGVTVTVSEPDKRQKKIAEQQLAPLRKRIGA